LTLEDLLDGLLGSLAGEGRLAVEVWYYLFGERQR
jgi:hypothetical protein